MKVFDDLTDSEWALVRDLFDREPSPSTRRGRPPVEARAVVNAVLWVLVSGQRWSRLPGWYPSQPTCRRRFDTWQADGKLAEMVRRLETSGRAISLRDKVSPAASKALAHKVPAHSFSERLRGAFWTNPASWRAGPTEQYRQSD